MRKAILLLVLMLPGAPVLASECVVLLHGLARTAMSMNKMERELAAAGYLTANIDYPSREHTVEELAELAVPEGIDACRSQEGVDTIHFVTHSLGGILLRQYLQDHDLDGLHIDIMSPVRPSTNCAMCRVSTGSMVPLASSLARARTACR